MVEIDYIADLCAAALRSQPAGLLTDIDGTISLIAQTPDSATVSDHARASLQRLSLVLDVTGAITGRAAENAERMVGLGGLVYIGNHGLERRLNGETTIHPDAVSSIHEVTAALDQIRVETDRAGLTEGILYENKGVTSSIHYRLAQDPAAARAVLIPIITQAAAVRGLKVVEGRMVIEIRPSVSINKGSAVRSLIVHHGLRGVVFLGDDVTDLDAFDAVKQGREAGEMAGVNVAVVAAESNPIVAERADAVVHGVDACVALLHAIADRLESGPGEQT